MIEARTLNESGLKFFADWLDNHEQGESPPADLLTGSTYSEPFSDAKFEPTAKFAVRFDFGCYLLEQLGVDDLRTLLEPTADGFWAWLAALYFDQLGAKQKKIEHYIVKRRGHSGSLAYRQGPRTCYELVAIHGSSARVCLNVPMQTFGEMAEQLASRQTLARNTAFFRAASHLYLDNSNKLRRGASSKPKKPKDRPPGNRVGFGSARRLGIALQRLDLTYDTEEMQAEVLINVLPKEFKKISEAAATMSSQT